MIKINKEGLAPLQIGRLNKSLSKQYRFSNGQVMTLEQYILLNAKDKKESKGGHFNRRYFNNLTSNEAQQDYESRLKEKVTYYIVQEDNSLIDIPKIVYDCLVIGG